MLVLGLCSGLRCRTVGKSPNCPRPPSALIHAVSVAGVTQLLGTAQGFSSSAPCFCDDDFKGSQFLLMMSEKTGALCR